MSLDRTLRLRLFRVVGDGKGGFTLPLAPPTRVPGKSAKHQPPGEDILTELICNVLLDAVFIQASGELFNWVISPAFGLFQP